MPQHLHVWLALAFMSWVIVISLPAHTILFTAALALLLGVRFTRRPRGPRGRI